MKWSKRLYLGTWQFGGQFKQMSSATIESLLHLAIKMGICRFDTASVYGDGEVEKMLGTCLPDDAVIVTKIPAIRKLDVRFPATIQNFYSRDHLYRNMGNSLDRLKRTSIDTILLHNWLPSWSEDAIGILQYLGEMKREGIAKRVGISLPDGFLHHIDQSVLSHIDVIEAPFNPNEQWILGQLPTLLELKKEVLLRSLFCQGKILVKHQPEVLLHEALGLDTSVVIGMTTEEQIFSNIKHIKGEYK